LQFFPNCYGLTLLTVLQNLSFTEEHDDVLKEILDVLTPIEEAVVKLSAEDSNLIIAEGAINFVCVSLKQQNTELSRNMLKALQVRVSQRRKQDLVTLIIFLCNGKYPKNNEFLKYSSKPLVKELAVKLYDRMFPSNNSRVENEEPEEQDVSEVFNIEASISSFQQKQQNSDLINTVDKDLKYFELTGNHPKSLQLLYDALLSIRPTSTFNEQVFSVAGNFKNKIRNRTSEKTLNALVWLKIFFSRTNDK
jgi:hypothetical protein